MAANANYSLHHLRAPDLPTLEAMVSKMNLLTTRSTEVFQVTKDGNQWIAHFNIDSLVFADHLRNLERAKKGRGTI